MLPGHNNVAGFATLDAVVQRLSKNARIEPVGFRHRTRVPRPTSTVSMFVGLQAPPST